MLAAQFVYFTFGFVFKYMVYQYHFTYKSLLKIVLSQSCPIWADLGLELLDEVQIQLRSNSDLLVTLRPVDTSGQDLGILDVNAALYSSLGWLDAKLGRTVGLDTTRLDQLSNIVQ